MERDGLLTVEGDRHLELSPKGRQLATRVMRKHRLAERLLTDIIGLEIEYVHEEACRWEHVMSEQVERRLVELLDHPSESPYGNPIPGLSELGEGAPDTVFLEGVVPMTKAVSGSIEPLRLVVRRISEPLQTDTEVMSVLRRVGVLPGNDVLVSQGHDGVIVARQGETAEIDDESASHIFVSS
jgi:DtxR family Mn-dependent transcriptional regulator